ncbi:TPA: hypothetical protein SMV88_004910 [Pseudomonas aeruginosa]|nr:hypothetical protein [Pseudomonas aeruginosa]HEK3432641.1 hypothetical protein [Pseudomonas aeruginosa]
MSNCSHEAWDFGALQCPDCGAVKGHVADADYAKLEAEAQALREEVAALRMAREDFKLERDLARQNFCDEQAANYQLQAHLKACLGELSELRARVVVVPGRKGGQSTIQACTETVAGTPASTNWRASTV